MYSLSIHNIHFLLQLMGKARAAIIGDCFPDFLRSYFRRQYGSTSEIPQWAVTALRGVGVDLLH